ncbi:MAG: AAA family ATPase [Syntrophomonadaceae bacterium]|nr:AAA family ATPase [Syntrophomonadaceae bacterium]
MQQFSTGVKGLDIVLCGGLRVGSSVLIEGAPGSGKTTLGVQTIVEGVKAGDPGIILTFEQFPDQIYRDSARYGWDLPTMERENKLKVICTSPQVINDQLLQVSGPINQLIKNIGAKRILIDSFTHFRRISMEETNLRELMFSLMNSLKQRGLTVLFTKEFSPVEAESFEEYLVDTIISLTYQETPTEGRRRLVEVLKSRGHEHLPGKHSFKFSSEGLQVFPRHLPQIDEINELKVLPGVLPTGIEGLDSLLGGGVPNGSNILLCGPAGVGKTTLSLQTIHNALQDRSRKAVLFLHEEMPEYILRRAESFGWDFRKFIEQGQLIIKYEDFIQIDIDEYLLKLNEMMQAVGPSLVVVDTLPTLMHNVSHDIQLVAEKIARLTRVIKYHRCNSLLISPSTFGAKQIGRFGFEESFCDGVIILGTVSFEDARKRHIEVYKLRNQKHITGLHRMEITEEGIRIFYVR